VHTVGRHALRVPDGTDGPPNVPLWMDRLATDLSDVAKDNQGTLAARPVSTAPSPGIAGRYYRDSDRGYVTRDYGTGWQLLAPGHGAGNHVDRPAASAELNGFSWTSTDRGMTWICSGGAWVLVNAEPVAVANPPSNAGASAGIDGQRISLPWGKTRVIARFNAALAGAAKWEVEGTAPQSVKRQTTGNLQTADGTLYQAPLQVNIPWVGDYFVLASLSVRFQSGNTVATGLIIYNGADQTLPYMRFASGSTGGATWYETASTEGDVSVAAAGANLQVAANTGAAAGTPAVIESGGLSVWPLKIGVA